MPLRPLTLLLIGICLGVLTSFGRIVGAAPPAVLKSEFIYESAPFPSCHASTIAETKTGLVAAWFGGTAEGKPDVVIWLSRHVDGKWTAPVEVGNGVQADGKRYPCWNPVLFQPHVLRDAKSGQGLPGPQLLLFYKVGSSPSAWWGMVRSSTDGGQTWSDARRLPDGILGPVKNKPIQLSDGTIVSGSSTEGVKEPPSWRVHIERSTDGGQTWTRTDVAPGPDAPHSIQPSLLQLGEGRLQAVGRTRSGKLFTTTSTDDGKTWSPLALSALPNPNSGIDAVTLRDGRHLLIYNHTPKGRSPLNLCVSSEGAEWQAALVLESEPGEYSYPAIIQTADRLVHATYTWKRQRVKHVVIDPSKLQPRAMVNGEWPE